MLVGVDIALHIWRSLTEVCRVCVEDGQAHKLLCNLGPASNQETEQVAPLEDGPLPQLVVDFSLVALGGNSGTHYFLLMVRFEW